MAKKKTKKRPIEILVLAEDLIEELDGLVFNLSRDEDEYETTDPEVRKDENIKRPTKSQVKKAQTQVNHIWRTLQQYKDTL